MAWNVFVKQQIFQLRLSTRFGYISPVNRLIDLQVHVSSRHPWVSEILLRKLQDSQSRKIFDEKFDDKIQDWTEEYLVYLINN